MPALFRLMVCLCCALVSSVVPARVMAEEKKVTGDAAARVFTAGWSTAFESRAKLDETFAQLPIADQADSRVVYALALSLMYQSRFATAMEKLVELTDNWERKASAEKEVDATRVQAWRGRVWLNMLQKKYAAAGVDAERLGKLVAMAMPKEENKKLCEETAAFLGRMDGFLTGPAAALATEVDRVEFRKKASRELPTELIGTFEMASADVVSLFKDKAAEKQAKLEEAVSSEEAAKVTQLAELDREDQQIVRRREELQPRAEKLRTEFRAHASELERADAPLSAEMNRIRTEGERVQQDLRNVQNDLSRVDGMIARERDPGRREGYRREYARLDSIAQNIRGNLNTLQRSLDRVKVGRMELQRKYAQLEAQFGGELKSIEKEIASLDSKQKRNSAIRLRLNRPATGSTAKTAGLAMQASSLSTYDAFPLEAERQRVKALAAP